MRIDRLPVAAVMARELVCVQKEQSLAVAGQRMREHRIRHLPVVHDGWLQGIVSKRDIDAARGASPDSERDMCLSVGKIMTSRVFTAEQGDSVMSVARLMLVRGLGCVPVIDEFGWLLGMISASDVVALTGNLLRRQPPLAVCEVMDGPGPSSSPSTVAPHTPVWKAARLLADTRCDDVAVADQGVVVGRLRVADLLLLLVSHGGIARDHLDRNDVPVNYYMSSPVRTVAPSTSTSVVRQVLDSYRISSVLVCEEERVVGIVSRADLIGLDHDVGHDASSLMTTGVIEIDIATPLVVACQIMLEREVHQLVVRQHQRPVGIVSRSDCVAAVRDLRIDRPTRQIATPVAFTISADQTLAVADAILERADLGSLLVMDGPFAVGIYGPRQRLRPGRPMDSSVDGAMSGQILTVPGSLPAFRAAAQMVATNAELAVVDDGEGKELAVVTASDFARVVAELALGEDAEPDAAAG